MKRREFTVLGLGVLTFPARADRLIFERIVNDFLEELWAIDPDAAVAAGRFEFAGRVTLPSAVVRQKARAWLIAWLTRFQALDAGADVSRQMDRAMLIAKLQSDLWRLDVLKEWSWNPA